MKNKNKFPKVSLAKCALEDNYYSDRDKDCWSATKLIAQSKKYKPFDLPLCGIDLSGVAWGIESIAEFAHHAERVNNADLKYPIILDHEGVVCDGLHRIVKAILERRTTIKAIRLERMPRPDRNEAV